LTNNSIFALFNDGYQLHLCSYSSNSWLKKSLTEDASKLFINENVNTSNQSLSSIMFSA